MRLLLAGGGTGGHVFPAVALAERLLETTPSAEVLFVGTARGLEARVLPQLGFPLQTINISGWMGRGPRGKIAVLPQLLHSVWQSRRILRRFKPEVVVGVGGYASAPALLAARSMGLPTLIHEQNAWPGVTNRFLSRWADRICLSFADAECAFHHGRTVLTGNPLRRGMEDCPPIADGDPQLLIFGGSRGARAINEAVVAALPHLASLQGRLRIHHQTGQEDLQTTREGYLRAGWEPSGVVPFIEDMAGAYAQAHLVLCRAGATTIAELTACGRPAILIPYPYAAADHQSANARAVARRGAGLMLPQQELQPELLAKLLGDLLADRERLAMMAKLAHSMALRGAADRVLDECRAIRR
jgi:UDP-N-acetylglucosamine--N-acetylmuramyl-(pentapeptide) pyrophosphoryl-undecaprenol N-acetylglucosamine transferase